MRGKLEMFEWIDLPETHSLWAANGECRHSPMRGKLEMFEWIDLPETHSLWAANGECRHIPMRGKLEMFEWIDLPETHSLWAANGECRHSPIRGKLQMFEWIDLPSKLRMEDARLNTGDKNCGYQITVIGCIICFIHNYYHVIVWLRNRICLLT